MKQKQEYERKEGRKGEWKCDLTARACYSGLARSGLVAQDSFQQLIVSARACEARGIYRRLTRASRTLRQ